MGETCANEVPVLVFAPFGKDAALVQSVLHQSGIAIESFGELHALEAAIDEDAGAAIITEEVLQNGTIAVLAERIAQQPRWSDFPIIVLTGSGMSTASTESAVRSRAPLGNVTLLERPLRPVTLISAVRSALLARKRQYEVRDHLREREVAEEALRRAHDALETLVEQRTAALRRLSVRWLRAQDEEVARRPRHLSAGLGEDLPPAKITLDMLEQKYNPPPPPLRVPQTWVAPPFPDPGALSFLLQSEEHPFKPNSHV